MYLPNFPPVPTRGDLRTEGSPAQVRPASLGHTIPPLTACLLYCFDCADVVRTFHSQHELIVWARAHTAEVGHNSWGIYDIAGEDGR